MRFILLAAYAAIFIGCQSIPAKAAETQVELKAQAKITQDQAAKIALAKIPNGKIQSAELERENGKLIWSFDISVLNSTNITEVWVDAETGKITSTQIETQKKQIQERKADGK